MPIPALAALVLQKVGQTKQNAMNLASTWWFNRQERKWNEKMYQRQRDDAMSDWHMNNEYNSPKNQMARFSDANLNPNLIYGQTNEAPAVRSSSVQNWSPRHPELQFNETGGLQDFTDLELKQAQTNNLNEAAKVAIQQQQLTAAQTAKTVIDTDTGKLNLDTARQLQSTALEKAKADLLKVDTEIAVARNRDEREALSNTASLKEAAARLISIRETTANTQAQREQIRQGTENLRKDALLKEIEIGLRKQGINPSDPAWQRWLQRVITEPLEDVINDFRKTWNATPGNWRR